MGSWLARSTLAQVTIELFAVLVSVADGAPLPLIVLFVAGDVSTCAPDQRSTTIVWKQLAPGADSVTVIEPGDPDTTEVKIVT